MSKGFNLMTFHLFIFGPHTRDPRCRIATDKLLAGRSALTAVTLDFGVFSLVTDTIWMVWSDLFTSSLFCNLGGAVGAISSCVSNAVLLLYC